MINLFACKNKMRDLTFYCESKFIVVSILLKLSSSCRKHKSIRIVGRLDDLYVIMLPIWVV